MARAMEKPDTMGNSRSSLYYATEPMTPHKKKGLSSAGLA